MAYKYEYAKSNLNVFIKGLELLAQENKWKFDSIEELMTTKLLKDKDLLRIKQLRVKDLAEKYEVCINRITLKENGEIDQEIQKKKNAKKQTFYRSPSLDRIHEKNKWYW